jgi:hypothetical protein
VWQEVVMENHTHTPAVHGKSHTSMIWRCAPAEREFGRPVSLLVSFL